MRENDLRHENCLFYHAASQVLTICWLFDAINTDEDIFLIHIDRKSSDEFYDQIRSYVKAFSNVSLLPRHTVTWCGWSQVSSELQAIKVLLDSEPTWQYLTNLSGQDYPIKSIEFIKRKLPAEWPRNFIRAWPFAKVQELEPNDPHLKRVLVFEVFGRLVRTPLRLPFSASIDFKYKGPAWHMLTRDFCRWVLANPMTKRMAKLVKHTWNPDELFFPALIMNSPYRHLRTEHFGREIIWGPGTFGIKDYDRLCQSPALFARKFDDSVDQEVLVRLACDNGYRVPPVCQRG